MRVVLALLTMISGVAVHATRAQSVTLAPATRVRYTLVRTEQTATAEVVVQRGDSLWVRSLRSGERQVIALRALSRLEISRAREGHGVRGAGMGLLAGAVGGGLRGYLAGRGCSESWCASSGELARNGAIAFGVIGAGIGAILGAHFKTDRWEDAPLTPSLVGKVGR